jgi:iron complex transport system substrate-binding protein
MLLLAPSGMHLAEAVAAWRAAPRPAGWSELRAVRHGHVVALDASAYVSRPGPRVIEGIELLAEIFDPAAFVDLAPAGSWVPVP